MTIRQKIDKSLEIVLVAIMSILVIDVLWQVFSRYVLSAPSSFTDELAGFLLIWVGLLGAAYVAGKNEHLAIDLMLQKLEGAKKRRLQTIINAIVGLFAFFVMLIGGSWLVYTRFYLGVKSAALVLPLGYVYLVVPISGILIIYYAIDNSLNQK
ncbi:TRAP transporter small permease [Prolixibacteraceae bacterium Z1-6]|uniref:TRAP transporter small permease n=1 Tax=Draconibacterium aestuarii TaxID=2998507 RepID=A0A9X3FBM8_9BACT|nr:TRAP transporter small permease [Prolixibacteraceae bacterium Z1-6]